MASPSFHSLRQLSVHNRSSIKVSKNSSSTLRFGVPKHVSKFSVSIARDSNFSSSVGFPNGPDPLPLRLTRSPNHPLFWIGAGIGFSSLISLAFSRISSWGASSPSSSPQKYAWQAFKTIVSGKASGSEKGLVLSVDALEAMFDDPTVQELLYPCLPEQVRDPKALKWMLHNTPLCQQLQKMLAGEYDKAMLESLEVFDISSPEVRQLLDEIGLVPEQLVAKIMANPDVLKALSNPKIQKYIIDYYDKDKPMDCEQYRTDKEVASVLDELQKLFPPGER